MHKDFTSAIVLSTNTWDLFGKVSNLFTGLEQIKLEDPDFKEMFDAHGKNQVEARYILRPTMIERLKDIRRHHNALEAIFACGQVHMAIASSHNLFESGYTGAEITNDSIATITNDIEDITDVALHLGLHSASKI